MDLPERARVEKIVHGMETHWLSGKKICSGRSGQWRNIFAVFLKKKKKKRKEKPKQTFL